MLSTQRRHGPFTQRRSDSHTWESNAGFSISALTNTETWFFTMKGFTLDFLFFFRIISAMNLHSRRSHCSLKRINRQWTTQAARTGRDGT